MEQVAVKIAQIMVTIVHDHHHPMVPPMLFHPLIIPIHRREKIQVVYANHRTIVYH